MRRTELSRRAAGWATRLGFGLLVMTSACSSEPDDAGGGGGACVPGAASVCACADGSMAMATCDPTGALYGPCACPVGVVPMGSGGAPVAAPVVPAAGGSAAPTPITTPPAVEPMAMAGAAAPVMDPVVPMTEPVAPGDEVPAGDHCASVATWDPAWTAFEDEVLRLTNEWRAKGADCGSMGTFGAAGPLTMNAILRCSSRLHSKDMGENGFFDHTNLAGADPFVRMAAAGYVGRTMGENIAMGQQSPEEVVNGWIDSDGHCSNIMNEGFTELGVGYWEGESDNQFFNGNKQWTQNFGAPGGGGGFPWGG